VCLQLAACLLNPVIKAHQASHLMQDARFFNCADYFLNIKFLIEYSDSVAIKNFSLGTSMYEITQSENQIVFQGHLSLFGTEHKKPSLIRYTEYP